MNSRVIACSGQEIELIDQAKSGSLDAFNALVLKYQNLLYNHAYALLTIHQSAEDVTQESILKAFLKIDQYQGGSFRSWLLRIVTNTCCDEVRRLKRKPSIDLIDENDHFGEQESLVWLVDPCASMTAMLEQKELSRTIYQYLGELPGIYRSAITLIDLYDFDYIEAATVLKIPIGTLKSRLARGRMQMKSRLQLSVDPSRKFANFRLSLFKSLSENITGVIN